MPVRSNKPKWSIPRDKRESVQALLIKGFPPRAVEAALAIDRRVVSLFAYKQRKKGIAIPKYSDILAPKRQVILDLARKGNPPAAVAEKLGVKAKQVSDFLSRQREAGEEVPDFSSMLSPSTRRIIRLAKQGKSLDEIVGIVKKSKNIVSKRLSEARRRGENLRLFKSGRQNKLPQHPVVMMAQKGVPAQKIARKLKKSLKSVQNKLSFARTNGVFVSYVRVPRSGNRVIQTDGRDAAHNRIYSSRVSPRQASNAIRLMRKSLSEIIASEPSIGRVLANYGGKPVDKMISFVKSECRLVGSSPVEVEVAAGIFAKKTNIPFFRAHQLVQKTANLIGYLEKHSP